MSKDKHSYRWSPAIEETRIKELAKDEELIETTGPLAATPQPESQNVDVVETSDEAPDAGDGLESPMTFAKYNATLRKIRSNHNNLKDEYVGHIIDFPSVGQPVNFIYQNEDGRFRYVWTTPVLEVHRVGRNVDRFTTANSVYEVTYVERP